MGSLDVDNRVFQSFNQILRVSQTQTQRGLDSQHITEGTSLTEQQLPLPRQLHQLVGLILGGLLGLLVLDQLDTDHQPLAAHVSDNAVLLLQLGELLHQVVAHYLCVFRQFLLPDGFEHLQPDPALDMSSSEGVEEHMLNLVRNLLAGHHRSNGETITDTLGHGNDVGLDSLPLVTPVGVAHPPETRLHLVADDQTSVLLAHQLLHLLQVAFRQGVDAAHSLHALEDETGDLARGIGIEGLLGVLDELSCGAVTATVRARPGKFFKLEPSLHRGVPSTHIGDVAGITDESMVSIAETEELVLVGVESGQENSEVIGLSPRVAEIDAVVVPSQLLAELLGVLRLPLAEVDGRGVGQFGDLLRDHPGDVGVRVPQRNRGDTRNQVQVAVALVVVEVLQVSLRDQQRLLVVVEVEVRHVLAAVLGDGLIGGARVGAGGVVDGRKVQPGEGSGQTGQTQHTYNKIQCLDISPRGLYYWTPTRLGSLQNRTQKRRESTAGRGQSGQLFVSQFGYFGSEGPVGGGVLGHLVAVVRLDFLHLVQHVLCVVLLGDTRGFGLRIALSWWRLPVQRALTLVFSGWSTWHCRPAHPRQPLHRFLLFLPILHRRLPLLSTNRMLVLALRPTAILLRVEQTRVSARLGRLVRRVYGAGRHLVVTGLAGLRDVGRGLEQVVAALTAGRRIVLPQKVIPHQIVVGPLGPRGPRLPTATGHRGLLTRIRPLTAIPTDRMQPIRNLLNISLFSRLVDLRLNLLNLAHHLTFVSLGGEHIALDGFDLLDLLLQHLPLRAEFVLVRFEHLHSVGLQLGTAPHTVLQQQQLLRNRLHLPPHLAYLPLHHLVYTLQPGDLPVLLPAFVLGLQLQIVLLLQNDVDLHRPPLLRQTLLVDAYPPLHLLVFHLELLRLAPRLPYNREGG